MSELNVGHAKQVSMTDVLLLAGLSQPAQFNQDCKHNEIKSRDLGFHSVAALEVHTSTTCIESDSFCRNLQ